MHNRGGGLSSSLSARASDHKATAIIGWFLQQSPPHGPESHRHSGAPPEAGERDKGYKHQKATELETSRAINNQDEMIPDTKQLEKLSH